MRRSRLRVCIRVVAVAGAATAASCTPEGAERSHPHPNAILISLDTLRADRLNTYGYDRHPTSPLIDALGRDGIVHEAHIASSPWTTPSHMSLLTSLRPASHGVIWSLNQLGLAAGETARVARLRSTHVTLAEAFAEAGYRTGAFTGGLTVDPRLGFDQGFEVYSTSMYKITTTQMQPMLAWLAAGRGRPFFLFWHTFEIHGPYTRGRFLPSSLSGLREDLRTMTRRIAGKATVSRHEVAYDVTGQLVEKYGADAPEIYSDLYDGGIAAADFWVGRLVAFLVDQELYDSTMIVLTSDHGEELGDHDPTTFRGRHGDSAYEEMLRVPLVVKLPGSDHAGLRIDAVTRAIDVMPTVLEVAGVEGPRDRMQGTSLVGLWNGAREASRTAFSEASAYAEEFKSVRDSRYKLIFEIGPDTVAQRGRSFVPRVPMRRLLFDLDVDPGETSNLLAGAASPLTEQIAADLEKKLRSLAEPKPAEVEEVGLDVKTLERLRAMGYVR